MHRLWHAGQAAVVWRRIKKGEGVKGEREGRMRLYGQIGEAEQRELCCQDLFYLLVDICGRRDMNNDWCFARCKEVQSAPNGYLDLWAREHYKSTIITVGLTIQEIIRNPDITVGIFSHTRSIATAFLRQIKREFEQNIRLQKFFPHIAPPGRADKRMWSESGGLVVVRESNPKEATLEAWGLVDGQPIGKHFDLLVYDDVVTRASVNTPEQIAKTTEAWALSLNLGAHGGHRRIVGTRYHYHDTYQEILSRGAAIPRIYPATDNGKADGKPVFLSQTALRQKRRDMGPYVFGCQMLQDPVADRVQGFLPEWFHTVPDNTVFSRMHKYIVVDPAGECKKDSDYTVMWVVGLGQDQNYYVIDGIRERLNLTGRADALFALHKRYTPLGVGYQKYGQQADIEHITDRMSREGYFFPITPLGGNVPKNDRIRKLTPLFEQGRVFFKQHIDHIDAQGQSKNLGEVFLRDEFTQFPVSRHDDMLDCLARIVDPNLGAVFPPRGGGKQTTRAINGFETEFFM